MAALRSAAFAARRAAACPAVRRPQPVFAAAKTSPAAAQWRLFSAGAALREKKYTEDHEWIEFSQDGKTATLGISTYAANALGDVVYIEMPEAGLEVSAGEAIGAVESVKSASDILSPVGGKVVEVNEELQDKPGQLNKDPEGAAWLARLEVEGEAEGKLMSEEEYKAFTEEA